MDGIVTHYQRKAVYSADLASLLILRRYQVLTYSMNAPFAHPPACVKLNYYTPRAVNNCFWFDLTPTGGLQFYCC